MWHQCALHQCSVCEFVWQLPYLRFILCCLSSYWRSGQSDQWDFPPWAADVRRGQNCNQSRREMKDDSVRRVALWQLKSVKRCRGCQERELLFCMVLRVSEKISCVSGSDVTRVAVRGQRLYILFIVSACTYSPSSPVWCSLDVNMDDMWWALVGPEVENWL